MRKKRLLNAQGQIVGEVPLRQETARVLNAIPGLIHAPIAPPPYDPGDEVTPVVDTLHGGAHGIVRAKKKTSQR